jgi:hypothetical protein
MPTRFLNRPDALRHAQKEGWTSFRTKWNEEKEVWEARYEPRASPANEWAKGKDFVAWTEAEWVDGVLKGVLIVSCTKEELAEENIPEEFLVEPQVTELWEPERKSRTHSAGQRTPREPRAPREPHGERERSTVEGPTRLVHAIADEMSDKSRKEIIDACVARGIHPSTAATQYSKWRKKRLAT